ncbi:MAG TPA: response regulator, partial [Candidatus Melainabacteria bacterium]|nr:response regulator [Candidatus Melainabacteria bacterium]
MQELKRVMIVDDDETIIETLTYNLKRLGFEVVPFKRSMDALSGLEEAAPDLIVIDWMLPDQSGLELTRQLK